MTPEYLANELKMSKEFLDRATRSLTEEDSDFTPDENIFTVAVLMAHIGLTVDWYMEGAFGKGFDMDFESHDLKAQDFTSLEAARKKCDETFQSAIELIGSKSIEELLEPWPEDPIMGTHPKLAVVAGIVEHTAHHRGALGVYTRLRGKVPPLPYMDMDAIPSS